MRCTRRLENLAYAAGRRCVAGVDEVGRGALFGPVVAAAVVLGSSCRIAGIDDSKRLSPAARAALEKKIRAGAVAYSVAAVDAAGIDRINIYQASRQAMRDAVLGLDPRPDLVLVDALRLDLPWEVEQRAIIHGDARSISIAAASILAKVHRDRLMVELDARYPGYGFAQHKGYSTPEHLAALHRLGACSIHRRSFAPVRACAQCELPFDS